MLEGLKEKVIKAVGQGSDDFPVLLIEFISTALHIPAKYFQDAEWTQIIQAFYKIVLRCPIVKLPLTEPSNDTSSPENWDYEGRTWHLYAHLIAEAYGWTFNVISNLHVLDALATIQEILTQKQLDREFQHGLSEIAYPYNAQTKKSEFKALPRPHWMRARIMPVMKFKMPTSSLPVGNVDYDALPEELRPQPFVN